MSRNLLRAANNSRRVGLGLGLGLGLPRVPAAAFTVSAAAAAQPPSRRPPRLRSSTAPLSTLSTGHPTSAISTRNPNPFAIGTSLLQEERQLEVIWDDGHSSLFDWTWLRVNCPSCRHENGHRTVFPGDIDPGLAPREVSTTNSLLAVTWSDGHVSEYRNNWLRAYDASPSALHEWSHGSFPTPLCAWDAIPKIDGREYMEDDEALYAALRKLNRTGVVLLENVGAEERTVLGLARRVAPTSHHGTHGEMFDIVSQDRARSESFDSESLRFHMELAYYESPPGLQFLHCIEFEDGLEGGATTLMDAFAAAQHLREYFPEKFEVLSRVPTTFEMIRTQGAKVKGDDRDLDALTASQIESQKPIFQVNADGDLLAVTWAPMFEGVLMCAPKDAALYHAAHGEFLHLIEEGPYAAKHTVRKRLKPGQCLIINNRRMLRGREAFSQSGSRSHRSWFQSTFVSADDAMSRMCGLLVGRRSPSVDGGGDESPPDYLTRFGNGSLPRIY